MEILLSGESLALASAVFWAVAVVMFKTCGESIPPLTLNLFKSTVALVCFLPAVLLVEGAIAPDRPAREWLLLAASGLLGITLADTFFFAALNRLGAGLNAIVDCLYAPSMIFFAHLLLSERLSALALLGTTLILTGILFGSVRPEAGPRNRRELVVGILYGAAGMISISLSIAIIKPFLAPERILWATTLRLACGTVALLPLILLRSERRCLGLAFRPSRLYRITVPASIFGSVLAMACWIAGMTLLEVSFSSVLNQLSTIFIFLLAYAVLGEPLTRRRILAVALAFGGAALAWSAR